MEVSVTVSAEHPEQAVTDERFDAVLYMPYSNRKASPFTSDLQALVGSACEGDIVVKPEFPSWARDPKAEEMARLKSVSIIAEREVFDPNTIVFNREDVLLQELDAFRDCHKGRTLHFLLPVSWRSIPRELLIHLVHRLTLNGFKIKIAGIGG